ncbi:DUF1800 domain-containing protein [Chloroflexus sp.]|uniref:DUF1800 domain-containing protein n=1 Tax=Chloroflexus sp. TaxID=1904827 RepID=UPI00262159D7|nr:DUF1800 domain-containing protein [uncultured Chloroflexus sp.]
MEITRRDLIESGTRLIAGLAATGLAALGNSPTPVAACSPGQPASLRTIALRRLAFGPSPELAAMYDATPGSTVEEQFDNWVRQQLNPASIDDTPCDNRINSARLKIQYTHNSTTVNEVRPLTWLNAARETLWQQRVVPDLPWAERTLPYNEVRVATWIRAVYSRRQLFEVLVDFWHNHFNVRAESDSRIAATWPDYDRIIRAHALGNFNAMLLDVTKSVAMMYYLNNVSNRAGGGEGGNENFARELFELHTLGSDNYLKFYDRRENIPVVEYGSERFAAAYIDYDVYEASRCLTGWTIANGRDGRPNTGAFYLMESWHDNFPKTVLAPAPAPGFPPAPNFPYNNGAQRDGEMALRLTARHPGTARHICAKLCRRLVADDPPVSLVDTAYNVWMQHRDSPDQIRRVVEAILLSPEAKAIFGRKLRRPLEAIWAFLRATNATLPNDDASVSERYWGNLLWSADQTGHRLFGWDTPTGHPDRADYWANTNALINTWNMFYTVQQSWGGNVAIDIVGQTPGGLSCTGIVDFWLQRMLTYIPYGDLRTLLINFLAQGQDPNQPPRPLSGAPDWNNPAAVNERIVTMVQLLACSPEFWLR